MTDRPDTGDQPDDVRALRPTESRASMRKRQMALTAHGRQLLLTELAEIAAELDALQERAAEITARIAGSSIRLVRPA